MLTPSKDAYASSKPTTTPATDAAKKTRSKSIRKIEEDAFLKKLENEADKKTQQRRVVFAPRKDFGYVEDASPVDVFETAWSTFEDAEVKTQRTVEGKQVETLEAPRPNASGRACARHGGGGDSSTAWASNTPTIKEWRRENDGREQHEASRRLQFALWSKERAKGRKWRLVASIRLRYAL